jgi:hypothetical protein
VPISCWISLHSPLKSVVWYGVANDACPDAAALNSSAASTQTPTAVQALMMLGM